jgi:hypothetical protein
MHISRFNCSSFQGISASQQFSGKSPRTKIEGRLLTEHTSIDVLVVNNATLEGIGSLT